MEMKLYDVMNLTPKEKELHNYAMNVIIDVCFNSNCDNNYFKTLHDDLTYWIATNYIKNVRVHVVKCNETIEKNSLPYTIHDNISSLKNFAYSIINSEVEKLKNKYEFCWGHNHFWIGHDLTSYVFIESLNVY